MKPAPIQHSPAVGYVCDKWWRLLLDTVSGHYLRICRPNYNYSVTNEWCSYAPYVHERVNSFSCFVGYIDLLHFLAFTISEANWRMSLRYLYSGSQHVILRKSNTVPSHFLHKWLTVCYIVARMARLLQSCACLALVAMLMSIWWFDYICVCRVHTTRLRTALFRQNADNNFSTSCY